MRDELISRGKTPVPIVSTTKEVYLRQRNAKHVAQNLQLQLEKNTNTYERTPMADADIALRQATLRDNFKFIIAKLAEKVHRANNMA